ncbi:MAG: 2-hydroxyacyl-CoA dehydratase [Desulfobacteraceae bacterium]|nr:2-hydroxyacyl-CoA dehydratase [Desulfobacteraceae bacterium]
MGNYYDGLLLLCGFSDEDIIAEETRIEKTFNRLNLGPDDMQKAESWVKQHHDVDLLGVRKLLGAWLKELVDLVLSKDEGKKVVYYGYPTIQGPGMAIKAAALDEIYCACPDVVLCHTLGQIFNKLNPILEAGEENGLPPGHGLCSLQQIRVGALAKGIIPIPDLVLTSSYYCDMGSKTDELLHEIYGHPAIYIDGSMDSRWGEYPDYTPQRVEFLGAQLNKLFRAVNHTFGIEVDHAAWEKAMSTSRHLFHALGQLTRLMMADPIPLSSVETGLALQLSQSSTGRSMSEGPQAVDVLCQEVQERVNNGYGVVEKGAPRVLSFAPSHSDPSITHMIEDTGLAMAATIITVPSPKPPQESTYSTLGELRAEREMLVGFYHSSYGLIKRFAQAVKDLKLDGIIWNYIYNCRPMAQPSHTMKRYVEENALVPTLSLEMDFYDSRNYSAAALRTRVEAFADMLRARKSAASIQR